MFLPTAIEGPFSSKKRNCNKSIVEFLEDRPTVINTSYLYNKSIG